MKAMTQQEFHEVPQGLLTPEKVSMTLAEFLENDIEGYEYVKGELVPMSPATRAHSKISVNVIRHLDQHVRENQLGEVHVEATFLVGERGLKPMCRLFQLPDWMETKTKVFRSLPTWRLRSFRRQMFSHAL